LSGFEHRISKAFGEELFSRTGTSGTQSALYSVTFAAEGQRSWFAKYETGSDRFGEQVSRIEFQGSDSLEDAQAFCEKNALDVDRAPIRRHETARNTLS
jgi:hypothetical protein